MAIEDFSAGYWRAGDLRVTPHDNYPVIENGLYDLIDRRLYRGAGAEPTFRIGLDTGKIFTPKPESAVPTDVLGVPPEMMGRSADKSFDDADVFILKPQQAHYTTVGDTNGRR